MGGSECTELCKQVLLYCSLSYLLVFFSHCDEVSGPFCRCDMVSKCMYTICKNLVLRVSVSSITNEKFMCQKFSLHFCSLETQHTLSLGSFWSVPNWPPLPLMLVALLTLPAHHCPSQYLRPLCHSVVLQGHVFTHWGHVALT